MNHCGKTTGLSMVIAVFFLSGCVENPVVIDGRTNTGIATNRLTDSECKLYQEAADALTTSQKRAERAILAGCPGRFVGYVASESEKRQYQLAAADLSNMPAEIISAGAGHRKLFQRLLVRGVPAQVAVEMIEGELFQSLAEQLQT